MQTIREFINTNEPQQVEAPLTDEELRLKLDAAKAVMDMPAEAIEMIDSRASATLLMRDFIRLAARCDKRPSDYGKVITSV